MERNCTVPGCNGRMTASTEIQVEFEPQVHRWQCNENPEQHTTTVPDAEISDTDILPPR